MPAGTGGAILSSQLVAMWRSAYDFGVAGVVAVGVRRNQLARAAFPHLRSRTPVGILAARISLIDPTSIPKRPWLYFRQARDRRQSDPTSACIDFDTGQHRGL